MDHFPKGSKIIQGIILSTFLAEIQKRHELQKKDHECLDFDARFNHARAKPFALLEQTKTIKDQNSSYRITEIGLTQEEGTKPFKFSQSSRQTGMVIDLMDHVPIDRVEFETILEYNSTINRAYLRIQAITNHESKEIHQQALDINHSTHHCVRFGKAIARALILHFEFEEDEDYSSSNTALLSNLSIQGPYHKLSGQQSKELPHPI